MIAHDVRSFHRAQVRRALGQEALRGTPTLTLALALILTLALALALALALTLALTLPLTLILTLTLARARRGKAWMDRSELEGSRAALAWETGGINGG